MVIDLLLLLAGLALLIIGAEFLVEGSSSIARKAGVSEFVIGLTIVGIGTSAPELVVSLVGAFQGNADVAVGNVIGSNVFNIFLILGMTALIRPLDITQNNRRRDLPLNIAATILLIVLGMKATIGLGKENALSRGDGIVFLLLFAAYLFFAFKQDSADKPADREKVPRRKPLSISLLMTVAGIAVLVFGGRLFVNAATQIARLAGMSDKFIAITVLAGGTSMPELVTCMVAAARDKGQLALGNLLGSNISNILLILGSASVVCPLSFAGMTGIDLGALALSAFMILFSVYTGRNQCVDRFDGILFLLCEAAYMTFLMIHG